GKQKFTDTIQERDRKESNHAHQSGRQHGQSHFRTAAFRRQHRGLPKFKVAVDVFERDYRVIDHTRKGQRHAAQNHGVYGAAHRVQNYESCQRGDGNRKQNSRSSPNASQKQQNHQRGQGQANQPFMQDGLNRLLHEHRLIEKNAGRELFGNIVQSAEQLTNTVHDGNRIRIPTLLHDRDVSGLLAVYPDNVVLNRVSILGVANIFNRYPRITVGLDGNVIQHAHIRHQAVGIYVIIEWPKLYVTRGQNQI